jgi:hypothetical protein
MSNIKICLNHKIWNCILLICKVNNDLKIKGIFRNTKSSGSGSSQIFSLKWTNHLKSFLLAVSLGLQSNGHSFRPFFNGKGQTISKAKLWCPQSYQNTNKKSLSLVFSKEKNKIVRIMIFCSFFWENWGHHKLLSRFTDL